MTQVEVAEAIGTPPAVYGHMERGAVMPSVPTLIRLCLTLGYPRGINAPPYSAGR